MWLRRLPATIQVDLYVTDKTAWTISLSPNTIAHDTHFVEDGTAECRREQAREHEQAQEASRDLVKKAENR